MFIVNEAKCIGCGKCVGDCFPQDIKMVDGKAVIRNATCISCGHCIAICPVNAVSSDTLDMDEVKEYNKGSFDVPAENLMNFIKFRRSIRQFKEDEVKPEIIKEIIDAGRFTQTGSNAQDVSYVVIEKEIDKLKSLTFESLNMAAKYYLEKSEETSALILRYAQMWIRMYEAYKEDPKANDRLFFNAPAVIIVKAKSQVNGVLASSNMELMTNALGLGTMFSGFFIRALHMSAELRNFVGVSDASEVSTCMVIGYPAVSYKRTTPRNKPNVDWR